jgi:predicted ATPase
MSKAELPRIEGLHIENYRSLRKVVLSDLTPFTVLVGPNGSGKSTIFDAIGFLHDCFRIGLRDAWQAHGRGTEIKTRGQRGPVTIGVTYRERQASLSNLYVVAIDEQNGSPIVIREELHAYNDSGQQKLLLLSVNEGQGFIQSDDLEDKSSRRESVRLHSPDLIAVSALGQLASHPRVAVLRDLISNLHVSNLSIAETRAAGVGGPQERLNSTGSNLPNVIQYLRDHKRDRWLEIEQRLSQRVPQLQSVSVQETVGGRLALQLKDLAFEEPIQARFVSDGTLKLLACLVLLYDPEPPRLIALEEPENYVHPRLARLLGEDCRMAGEKSQVLVTTHSPYFLSSARPREVWIMYRDESGYARARRVSDINRVMTFMDSGALLGDLWTEGQFGVGDPLTATGMPTPPDF